VACANTAAQNRVAVRAASSLDMRVSLAMWMLQRFPPRGNRKAHLQRRPGPGG
jgi:hypothetical protein